MRSGRSRKLKADINVVPYIDVMLVLLIIFMAVPPADPTSTINLPTAEKSTQPPDSYIQVMVRPENRLSIGVSGKGGSGLQDVADRDALRNRLRSLHEEHPEYPVLISGDKEVKYDEVIQLISDAKRIGIDRVGLATK
jgi:biopolymer transport protein TolR